jgi:hypothetical protein
MRRIFCKTCTNVKVLFLLLLLLLVEYRTVTKKGHDISNFASMVYGFTHQRAFSLLLRRRFRIFSIGGRRRTLYTNVTYVPFKSAEVQAPPLRPWGS